jgi:hypothetical protein
MNPSTHGLTQLTAVAGSIILSLFSQQEAMTRASAGLVVRQTVVQGNTVTVTVANLSPQARTGAVIIQALSESVAMGSLAPVFVPRRGTTRISVELPSTISGGVTVGVVLDDGAPF